MCSTLEAFLGASNLYFSASDLGRWARANAAGTALRRIGAVSSLRVCRRGRSRQWRTGAGDHLLDFDRRHGRVRNAAGGDGMVSLPRPALAVRSACSASRAQSIRGVRPRPAIRCLPHRACGVTRAHGRATLAQPSGRREPTRSRPAPATRRLPDSVSDVSTAARATCRAPAMRPPSPRLPCPDSAAHARVRSSRSAVSCDACRASRSRSFGASDASSSARAASQASRSASGTSNAESRSADKRARRAGGIMTESPPAPAPAAAENGS